jgi:Rrf2 family transcriptional regulator, iron-sulfur cluster assembly transcription factor
MKLTRAGEYAVRCVLYLAVQEARKVVSRREIAEAMDIPFQFLGKVAQQLAKAGVIEIRQGAQGGLRLLLQPCEVSLLKVVEAIDGEIFLNDCLLNPESCNRVGACGVHRVWTDARRRLRDTLDAVTFEKLAAEEMCLPRPLGDENIILKDFRS